MGTAGNITHPLSPHAICFRRNNGTFGTLIPCDTADPVVIRSKNAGIGRLTFDLFFNSGDNYEAALLSNAFCRVNIAKTLRMDPERVVGTYFADACNAIKITIDRPLIAATRLERDLCDEQQQVVLEELSVPIYSGALATASSF
jgi:hypothetical protein